MQKSAIHLFHDIQEAEIAFINFQASLLLISTLKQCFFPSQSVFCPVRFLDGQHALKRKDTVAVHID